MASTYTTNSGIEKIASGEQNATWGDTTNTNWDIVDVLVGGGLVETLPAVGTSGAPNDIAVTDGAVSDGQNAFISFADGGDLGGTAYVRLTPNNAERVIWVQNNLSGSQSINVFQGTYDASNDITIPAGQSACVYFDGAGAGAVVSQINSNIMGLTIGTDVQAYDADLTAIAGLAKTNSNFIVGNGSAWVAETGATARASMGVAIGSDVQAYDADLTTYAGNPLTSVELDQLQNIGAVTINATQWGYLGSMSGQPLESETSHADVLVDSDATSTNTVNKLMLRNSAGDSYLRQLHSDYVTMSHAKTTRSSDTTFYSSTDDYVRKNNTVGMRNSLGITKAYIDTLNVDADTLDGVNSTSFARADATDTISGAWTFSATTTFNGAITARPATGSVTTGTMTVAGNANKQVTATGGLTMPNAIFTAGDMGVVRAGASARTITRGASVTMYVNGTNSATATLTARGVMGFNWESSSVVYLTGDIS